MDAGLGLLLALERTDVFVGGVANVLAQTTADDTHRTRDGGGGSVFRVAGDGSGVCCVVFEGNRIGGEIISGR